MTFTTGKPITTILLSSIISVASTVTVINYAPYLVAMPIQQPDIQLFSVSYGSSLRCNPQSDWSIIDELTKTINVRQDSVLVIIYSSKVNTVYGQKEEADAYIHLEAFIDGNKASPSGVLITEEDENPGKVTTALYHYPSVKAGIHTVTFKWRNLGVNTGIIDEPIVEIMVIPLTNSG
jgi:hypothetical protein